MYSKFDELVSTDIKECRDFIAANEEYQTKEKCHELTEKYQTLGNEALKTSENEVAFPVVAVHCRKLKKDIEKKANELANVPTLSRTPR